MAKDKADIASDCGGSRPLKTEAARALLSLRDEIMKAYMERARAEIPAAESMLEPILINTIPSVLENLAEAIDEEHPRKLATAHSSLAREHGGERARLTRYRPEQLIKEYRILRETLVDKLSAVVQLSKREANIIQVSFDQALEESMMAFALVHTRLREQFVAALSHDLRNPLNAVKLSAQMILTMLSSRSEEELKEDLKKFAHRIVKNTRRADRMIQNLLDASILQVGEKLNLTFSECSMHSIVRDVVDELDRAEQARLHIQSTAVHGFWDGEALRRAVENLINNAFKYGDAGGAVTVRVWQIGERVALSVHNTGNPIPPEDQEHLFQAFQRSASAKSSGKQGWGLGLALVREVAEAHGGSIVVDSSIESGTAFTIDIPIDSRPFESVPTSQGL